MAFLSHARKAEHVDAVKDAWVRVTMFAISEFLRPIALPVGSTPETSAPNSPEAGVTTIDVIAVP